MKPEKIIANGWTADLPDGWEDRSLITIVGAVDESGFAPNIVVTRQIAGAEISLAEYAAEQAAAMEQEIGTMQILDERETEVNGAPAFQRLQRFALDTGEIFQQVQTFFLADDVILAVTGTASLAAFDRSIPAFKRFVETFELHQK